MKTKILAISMLVGLYGFNNAQNQQKSLAKKGFDVNKVFQKQWNTSQGLTYLKVQGANLGVTSFEEMDNNKVAFLSDASNEVIVTEKASGKTVSKFSLPGVPKDFAYDNGSFYVLFDNSIAVYNESGKTVSTLPVSNGFENAAKITRYNNATYLLLASGNSVKVGGKSAQTEVTGWITSGGSYVYSEITGDNSYKIQVTNSKGRTFEKNFTTPLTTAGVFVVGATKNRVVLDVQTYISQDPIIVERHLITVELTAKGLGSIISDVKVPDCYYVLSNNDFDVAADGSVLNMVTAPEGLHLFSIKETEVKDTKNYPASIANKKYHFNDNLVSASEQK